MPAIELSSRHQYAVLWVANGVDDYGNVTVASPVEVKVRWVWGRKDSLNAQGVTIALDAQVTVDRSIPVESVMRLGKLKNLPITLDNLTNLVSCDETPDVKGRVFCRVVGLVRRSDTLPTVV